MDDIFIYTDYFAHLSVCKTNGDYAPHKPILLISIMDLVQLGKVTSQIIKRDSTLITYFEENWKRYAGQSQSFQCNIDNPFKHIASEAFWHPIDYNTAEIDEELFDLMKDTGGYTVLKKTLITSFLPQSINKFNQEIAENDFLPREIKVVEKFVRSNKQKLEIKIDGQDYTSSNATKLFVDVIKFIGVERVAELNIVSCGIPLIDIKKDNKYGNTQKDVGNGYYLNTHSSTTQKKKILDRIIAELNLQIQVRVM